MTLLTFLKIFLLTFPVFLAVDAIWLGLVAKKFISRHMEPFALTLRLIPALFVYVLLVAGNILLPVQLAAGNILLALLYGAAFGLATYGTYDLTNYATLKDYSPVMTAVDLVWGSSVMAFVAVVGTLFFNWLA